MRTRTGLGLLICCCAALAGCTAAARKGPDTTVTTPAVGRPSAPASAQAAVSAEAFTPYATLGLSSNDGLAPGESLPAFAVACMTVAGYPGAGSSSVVPYVGIGISGACRSCSPGGHGDTSAAPPRSSTASGSRPARP